MVEANFKPKITISDVKLDERKLSGESLLVSLKVPVEEVFLGSNEPVVAFRDETSTDWKKGVFTTHTQFDQSWLFCCILIRYEFQNVKIYLLFKKYDKTD